MSRPSVGGWREPNPSAFVRRAGDDGVELLSNLSREQQRGGGLVDLALNFGGGVFLIGAVLGQFRQLRNGVGQRLRPPARLSRVVA